ncbi:hypothetical protein Bhyg_08616, partial [Pseudolycoriella hygida]
FNLRQKGRIIQPIVSGGSSSHLEAADHPATVLLLSAAFATEVHQPPCRYNCPETEKLVCATFKGENQTFINRCQMELFNCLTRTKWQIFKKGPCDKEEQHPSDSL